MRKYLSLAAFLLLVVGGGTVIGLSNLPGEWYAGLNKPSFNPPDWVFGPVWTALYVLIATAGWRVWLRRDRTSMALWWSQLALNFAWSPVFFGMQRIGLALLVIVALLGAIAGFMIAARNTDRVSSLLFAPYAAWVAFAAVLNAALAALN